MSGAVNVSQAGAVPKILVTGADGQVGFELMRSLALVGEVVAVRRAQMDLTDAAAMTRVLDEVRPDVIVNPAAYTAVDKAESDADTAEAVNVAAVGVLGRWAQANGAMMVHYSTDYVFEGVAEGAYREDDPVAPQSVYGATKERGEALLRSGCAAHFIFRTSWVFGAHGNNFLKTMLKLMQTRDALKVVNDQVGTPTSAGLIADVTAHVLRSAWAQRVAGQVPAFGTYHLTASGAVSWHGYAQYIAQLAVEGGLPLTVAPNAIEGIPSSAYPTPAKRPTNSRMDTTRLSETFGVRLPDWQEGVRHVFTLITEQGR